MLQNIEEINPFMHNVKKWPKILLKFCGVHNARLLKHVLRPFLNIMHEIVKVKYAFASVFLQSQTFYCFK